MKLLVSTLLLAGAAIASPALAAPVFYDSFQTSPTLGPKYQANASGQSVAAPVGGGNALNFASTNSGQDLVSNPFTTGPGRFRLSVDYFCATAGGCGGYIGLYNGANTTTLPASSDGWLATDTQAAFGTPFTLQSTSATGFTHNSFLFQVTSANPFGVKLEDFSGAGGTAGDAYFKNLAITAVPEPAAWGLMILGFGAIGGAMRRRATVRTAVRFA